MIQLYRMACLLVTTLWCFQAPAFTISLTVKDAACGNSNGSIEVIVTGGTGVPPYNYLWSSGQTTPLIDNLSPGTYTVTVTDAMANTATDYATIFNAAQISGGGLSYVVPPPGTGLTHPCNNQCNGVAYFIEAGMNGTPPYSIYTSMGHTIGFYAPAGVITVEGICSPDVYTVYVTDALGCSGTTTPTFPYPVTSFDLTQTVTGTCIGAVNGQAELNLLNNQGISYQASWTGPTSGSAFNVGSIITMAPLDQGIYTVTLTNTYSAVPCDSTFTVNVPALSLCGTVSGKVYVDTVLNCVADASEPLVPGRIIQFTPGPYYGTSDPAGNYTAYLPYGTFDAATVSDYHFTSVCQVSGITLSSGNSTITGIDLGDSTGTQLDLSAHLMAGTPRPGFTYMLYVTAINHSFVAAPNPEAVVDYDTALTFQSCSVPYTVTGPHQLTLQLTSIGVFETVQALLNFTVAANPALIGTTMVNQVTINANQPEPNTANNVDILQQIISGSYDPNEKVVWPAFNPQHTYLADVDTLLRYTVRFQNTGTDTAFNVVVTDTLNPFLDMTSLQVIGSSHPCTWELIGQNVLRVVFANISLPDSNTNETKSHGMFSFTITHLPSLLLQPMPYLLENSAAIYFDFNPPVITNTAFNTVDISVGIGEPSSDSFRMYPNPVRDEVLIVCDDPASIAYIRITDLLGNVIYSVKPTGTKTILSLTGLSPGIYLAELEGTAHRQVKKLVKQ